MYTFKHALLFCSMIFSAVFCHSEGNSQDSDIENDYGFGISINNSAARNINKNEIDITLDGYKESLFVAEDYLSVSLGKSSLYSNSDSGYESAFGEYSMTAGHWYFNLSAGYSKYYGVNSSTINRRISTAYYNGTSQSFGFSIMREYEYSSGTFSLYAGGNYESHSDYSATDSFSPTTTYTEDGANTDFSLGINSTFLFETSSLYADYSILLGVPVLGANDDSFTTKSYEPKYCYKVSNYFLEYAVLLDFISSKATFISELTAQYSNSVLYSSKRFSIGGRHNVRGYGNDFRVSGDHGYYWRNTVT